MKHAVTTSQEFLTRLLKGDSRCAIKIGQRIIKVNSEEGDLNPNGTYGTIVGNIYHEETKDEAYYVRYDSAPIPIFTIAHKVELANE